LSIFKHWSIIDHMRYLPKRHYLVFITVNTREGGNWRNHLRSSVFNPERKNKYKMAWYSVFSRSSFIVCGRHTMTKNQKTIILRSHMHHKTLWRCHPSQTGQDGRKYVVAPIFDNTRSGGVATSKPAATWSYLYDNLIRGL
jgi:hypothetical protein